MGSIWSQGSFTLGKASRKKWVRGEDVAMISGSEKYNMAGWLSRWRKRITIQEM